MDPILIHLTNTARFILPLMTSDGITYKDIQTNLIGAYITTFDKLTNETECIFVVFNDDIKVDYFRSNYIEHISTFNEEYDTYDYIYVYKIEDNLLEDYFNFINGDYSQISEQNKQQILKFWEASETTLLYSILYKDKTNFKNLIKEHSIKNNPQQNLYNTFIDKYKGKKELYKIPNLKEEMYGYKNIL
jgi:hypothetical protein